MEFSGAVIADKRFVDNPQNYEKWEQINTIMHLNIFSHNS